MCELERLISSKYGADGATYVRRYQGLHFAKHIRLMQEQMGIRPGCRILDVGCGTGALIVELAQQGIEAVGIDTFQEGEEAIDRQIAEARAKAAGVEIELVTGNAADMSFLDGEFDIVVNIGMLEHVPPEHRTAIPARDVSSDKARRVSLSDRWPDQTNPLRSAHPRCARRELAATELEGQGGALGRPPPIPERALGNLTAFVAKGAAAN